MSYSSVCHKAEPPITARYLVVVMIPYLDSKKNPHEKLQKIHNMVNKTDFLFCIKIKPLCPINVHVELTAARTRI